MGAPEPIFSPQVTTGCFLKTQCFSTKKAQVATSIPWDLSPFPRGPQLLSPAKAVSRKGPQKDAWRFSPKQLQSPGYTVPSFCCRACRMASTLLLVHPISTPNTSRLQCSSPGTDFSTIFNTMYLRERQCFRGKSPKKRCFQAPVCYGCLVSR